MSELVITAENLTKVYQMGDVEVHALRGLTMSVERGEVVSIMGPSGSGKSTLMNIIGALDRPTAGDYFLDGERVSEMDDNQLAEVRNRKIGFVFQSFNLLPRATALSNVELPLRYAGVTRGRRDQARKSLVSVGLADRVTHRPTELSGGQQQRVAIARALVHSPRLLLADEPIGNLDSTSAEVVMELLRRTADEFSTTILMATHSMEAAAITDTVVRLRDGHIEGIERRSEGFRDRSLAGD